MITEIQLTEIRNYLFSKKLPIDILIEVNDHFVSQISDLQREENISFEDALEKVKNVWRNEFKTSTPFYILVNKDKVAITNFEKKIKIQNDKKIIKISIFITLLIILVYFFSLFMLDFLIFKLIHKTLLVSSYFFGILTVFYNLIRNWFIYKEKYKVYKFSVYQWRTMANFSLAYFILIFLKPIDIVFQKILVYNFSLEIIIKTVLYFSIFTIMIYTGIYHIRLIKTVKKLKYFLKYL